VKVYNAQFEPLWDENIKLKYKWQYIDIASVKVSDDGKVAIIMKVWKPYEERSKGKRNFHYEIILVSSDGVICQKEVEIGNHFIHQLKSNIDSKGDLHIGGLYSSEGKQIKGAFYMLLNLEDCSVKNTSKKEFGIEFITQGKSNLEKKKIIRYWEKGKDVGLGTIQLQDIKFRTNGGSIMSGEMFKTSSTKDGPTYYHYNDIYLVDIDPVGNIKWVKKVSKKQLTTDDYGIYSSYFLSVSDNHTNILYSVGRYEARELHAISFDESGNETSKILPSKETDDQVQIFPRSCKQVSDNQIIIVDGRFKYVRFAIIDM
jgi:hypothetical protein